MTTTILVTLAGIITTILGFIVGKRKRNAEVSLVENHVQTSLIEVNKALSEFYNKALDDTNDKLKVYIKLAEDNRKELEANRKEMHSLKRLVDRLIDDACLKKGCSSRVYYDIEK